MIVLLLMQRHRWHGSMILGRPMNLAKRVLKIFEQDSTFNFTWMHVTLLSQVVTGQRVNVSERA